MLGKGRKWGEETGGEEVGRGDRRGGGESGQITSRGNQTGFIQTWADWLRSGLAEKWWAVGQLKEVCVTL